MNDADDTGPGAGRLEPKQLLAHDIRSAVSDVIGGVRLMDSQDMPPDARSQLDRVRSAAELLARLMEELLNGTPRDTVGPVGNLNLRRFVDDELRRWHGAAQGTGVTVKADRAGNLPEIVQLPLLPLRRIVANLMSNALRHSGGNRVVLGTEVHPDGTLTICVMDNGTGLPDEVKDVRADFDTPKKDGARHGMGLHIADAHARAMGATLTLGRGSLGGAHVVLHIPRSVWSRLEPPEAGSGVPDLRGYRLLVADDSATNRLLLQAMLTRMGAECELARDGIEALNWLSREKFDLALIDIEMPVLGGLDVMHSERLRQARGIAPPTSMVAMTAYVLRDNREVIIEAGADGILAKPVGSIEAFGKAVWHFLQDAPDASNWSPENAPALSAAMLSDLMDAAGPEQEGDLLDRLREDLAMVEVRMTQALDHDDLQALAEQTHILLSLTTAVGALPTLQSARTLNRMARAGDGAGALALGPDCLAFLGQLRADLATAR